MICLQFHCFLYHFQTYQMISKILDTIFLSSKICICFSLRVYITLLRFSIFLLIENKLAFSSLSMLIMIAFKLFIYFWLCWIFVAFCAQAFSSCSEWRLLLVVVCGLLIVGAPLVEHRL